MPKAIIPVPENTKLIPAKIRRCKVCRSEFCAEYENMYLARIPISEIARKALEWGDDFQRSTLDLHLKQHLVWSKDEEPIKKEIDYDIQIKDQLEIIAAIKSRLKETSNKDDLDGLAKSWKIVEQLNQMRDNQKQKIRIDRTLFIPTAIKLIEALNLSKRQHKELIKCIREFIDS